MQAGSSTSAIPGETLTHACAVEVDGVGVLIEGLSGSGKTSVALGVLDVAAARGISAFLVSDDQVFLKADQEVLQARAPQNLAAKAELRGFGIIDLPPTCIKATTHINAVVKLTDDGEIERMPETQTCERMGVELPLFLCPQRHEAQAIRIILALAERLAR